MSKHEPNQRSAGWRDAVRDFTPAWFTATMGTGVVAILLHTFPYQARWLHWLSIVVFCFDIVLFTALSLIMLLRFILYPSQWSIMVNHPSQSLFISAWPMGFAQIIFMMIYVCSPVWGHWVIYLAWGMWIFDAALSTVIILLVPFLHMKAKTPRELISFTALEMLPFLGCIVASGTGSVVATALPHPEQALATIIASYILLGIGLPMAFIVTVIYTHRLILLKLPPSTVIASVFLPVGPPSMAGLAAIDLGARCLEIFPVTNTIHPQAGVVFYGLGVLWAFLLWGFAFLWLGFAIITICYIGKFEFNLGWWASTFPVALFASVSIKMGDVIPSRFFRILGAIVTVAVILLWMIVSAMTVRGVISGRLFGTPPLSISPGSTDGKNEDPELAEDVEKDD